MRTFGKGVVPEWFYAKQDERRGRGNRANDIR